MAHLSADLPPLEWIRVFEAAARLGSFTAAADELGLTQAAVSQRIRNLELRLAAKLFDRQPRGVALSTQGEAWLPPVRTALEQLAHATANVFAAPRRKVTVAASGSIIELWIAPRLPRVAAALPHLQLSFETIQRLPDYRRMESDLEIRFGDGLWPEAETVKLFDEELSPMTAPRLVGATGGQWRDLPRIATSGPRLGWRDWATARGEPLPPAPILRFDTFAQALTATEAGAGVLLGSLPLCREALGRERVVRLDPARLRMAAGYWILRPLERPRFPEFEALAAVLAEPVLP